MDNVRRGIVSWDNADGVRDSKAFPSICVLPDGRWLCAFRRAPTKESTAGQHVCICWSDNEGSTWSEPTIPFKPMEVDGKIGLFRSMQLTSHGSNHVLAALCWVDCSDPSLPFFNPNSEGLLSTKIFLTRSMDAGVTWSVPYLVEGLMDPHIPTPITGPPLILPDGTIVIQFEVNKPYYDLQPWNHKSMLVYSFDGGITWPRSDVVSSDAENRVFYWDQRPGIMKDGSILDLFWTYDSNKASYLPIHCRIQDGPAGSWGELIETGIPGQPAPPVDIGDGLVAMVYVDRSSIPKIKLCFSKDFGHSWTKEKALTLYIHDGQSSQTWSKSRMNEAWAEMGAFSVGLPDTASTEDGDLLVVFYAGPHANDTGIHWVAIPNGLLKERGGL